MCQSDIWGSAPEMFSRRATAEVLEVDTYATYVEVCAARSLRFSNWKLLKMQFLRELYGVSSVEMAS